MYSGKDLINDIVETLRRAKETLENNPDGIQSIDDSTLDLIDEIEERLDDFSMSGDDLLELVKGYEVSDGDKIKTRAELNSDLLPWNYGTENSSLPSLIDLYIDKFHPNIQVEVWIDADSRDIGESMEYSLESLEADGLPFERLIEKLEKGTMYEDGGCYEVQFRYGDNEIESILISEEDGIYFCKSAIDGIENEIAAQKDRDERELE